MKANAEEEAKKRERRETRKQRSEEKRARRRRGKEKAKGKECAKGGSENEKDKERKHKSSSSSKSERDAKREKQLLKLVGAAVVGYLSQHRQHLDNEQFKRHAKEVSLFHLLIPHINHNDLLAHAYDRGTREKRCDLPFRRQTRGVVRREARKNQEIRQELRGKALEETARFLKGRDERKLYFSRPQSPGC